MALDKLPCRATPICVQCVSGSHAYARGGFIIHVSCIPGLRDFDDILAIYTRVPTDTPIGRMHGTVYPEISGIVSSVAPAAIGAGTFPYSNNIRVACFCAGGTGTGTPASCLTEVSAGVDLSDIIFCVTVRGR